MPASFCLLPSKIEEFKQALKDKDIKIVDLINMDSASRTKLLEKYAGESAKDVNLLFEQKLVLKNKMIGIRNWASKVGEVGRYSPNKIAEFEKKLEEYKNSQFERTFNPSQEQSFLADLVETKFGHSISKEEAGNIFQLTEKVNEFKKGYNEETQTWSSKEDRVKYGASKRVLEKYIAKLKEENLPIKEQLKGKFSEYKQSFKENKVGTIGNVLSDTIKNVNDNTIAMVASFDNSFMGRQGLNTLMTHPSVWWKGAGNSFKDIYISIAKKDGFESAEDALWADIYSEPNYLNGNYEKAKLIPKTEEQYPTSLPERIPVLGRGFKASELAFTGSAIRMRTGLFDLLENTSKKNGVEMNDIQVKDLGKMINSVTARGESKTLEAPIVKMVLWAPKMLKANIDVLTAHGLGAGLETKFARQQAFKNIGKIAGETIGLAIVLNAIRPNTVELDPRSSDFLKLKFNNTRFDITGGKSSIITLVSRLMPFVGGYTKSTQTGEIKKINSGEYGASTLFDVGIDFLVNKMTPPARTVVDFMRGTDANFKPTTVSGELFNKLPISVQNFFQLNKDSDAPSIIGSFIDIFGINSNTYQPQVKKLPTLKKLSSPKLKSLPKLK